MGVYFFLKALIFFNTIVLYCYPKSASSCCHSLPFRLSGDSLDLIFSLLSFITAHTILSPTDTCYKFKYKHKAFGTGVPNVPSLPEIYLFNSRINDRFPGGTFESVTKSRPNSLHQLKIFQVNSLI